MSPSQAFHDLLIAVLRADPGVSALVGQAIYDSAPPNRPARFLALGPTDGRQWDEDCGTTREETVQIDGYDRTKKGALYYAKQLNAAVVAALHNAQPEIAAPFAISELQIEMDRVFRDSDNVTARSVLQVTAVIETLA